MKIQKKYIYIFFFFLGGGGLSGLGGGCQGRCEQRSEVLVKIQKKKKKKKLGGRGGGGLGGQGRCNREVKFL